MGTVALVDDSFRQAELMRHRRRRSARGRYRMRMSVQPSSRLADNTLPPLAGPDASDDERDAAILARMVARYGAPSLEHYRRIYAQAGIPWPGDEEIRRLHPVAAESAA
jgi:hypothetical protein